MGYRKLPPHEATFVPWYEVAVNLIDPWMLLVHGQEIDFYALTYIEIQSVTLLRLLKSKISPQLMSA
jgi:hypothetical protein